MAVAYKCDKCGAYYEWYEVCYADKKFNHMSFKELEKFRKDNPDAEYWHSPDATYRINCLHARMMNPINENMATNNGVLSADFEKDDDMDDNPLIMLCEDCMTDFINSLKGLDWQ